MSLEYKKYLEEVVQVLETDPEFKKELDKMSEDAKNDPAVCFTNLIIVTGTFFLSISAAGIQSFGTRVQGILESNYFYT